MATEDRPISRREITTTEAVVVDGASKQTCAICLEKYRRPKMLSCFHTFCQSCLQGVAGAFPSFPCPACRKVQLLPPGGVGDLQTNFYIEEDPAYKSSSSPHRRLCHVCSENIEATHSCLQCQQRYCLPCRQYHDSFTVSRRHTVVSLLTPEEEEEEEKSGGERAPPQWGREQVELCPRHARQELMLHCRQCRVDLCLSCKLTQHEGHPTEELTLTRSRVRDRLKDRLGTLTEELRRIDHLADAFEDRCTKLQQQKQTMEQAFGARVARLRRWVDQSLEDAVSSLQSSCQQRSRPWQEEAERLRHKKLEVLAQQEHILRVLREGKEADVAALGAQLSSAPPVDEVTVKRMEEELTRDYPTVRVQHNFTAVNQLQLRAFIGVLESEQQTSGDGERAVLVQPSDVRGKASCTEESVAPCHPREESVLAGHPREESVAPCHPSGVQGMDGTDSLPSASSCLNVVERKPPRELIYSENPGSEIGSVCPITQRRLWVRYRHAADSPWHLKLFDGDGQVLASMENPRNSMDHYFLLAITDDIMLTWAPGSSAVQLIAPDGSLSHHDLGIELDRLVSCATNGVHYLKEGGKDSLLSVKFTLGNADQTENTELESAVSSYPKSPDAPSPLSRNLQLTHSVSEVVFDDTPSNKSPIHASAGGHYFAFVHDDRVEVYSIAESRSSAFVCSYVTKTRSVRFCPIDGQEMLLVADFEDNKIHVVDHTEGGLFVCYLDTGPLNLDRPDRVATDFGQHVCIGCDGGKVVVVDL